MCSIALIWILFSCIFATLAIFHLVAARNKMENWQRSLTGCVWYSEGLDESIDIFIENLNKSNRRANILASIGYFAAMITSVISFFLSLDLL